MMWLATTLTFVAGTAAPASGSTPSRRLPVVAIDPGHGGQQVGATGSCGLKEKSVALAVSRELYSVLEASGRVRPILTRDGDLTVDLEERYRIANEAGAELLVSVHANASLNLDAKGVETFFLSSRTANRRIRELAKRENHGARKRSQKDDLVGVILDGLLLSNAHVGSQRFAHQVQDSLDAHLSTDGRGVLQAPFVVLSGAQMPAVLVEIGFLSNLEECKRLAETSYQRTIARSLAAAVLEHLVDESLASARQ